MRGAVGFVARLPESFVLTIRRVLPQSMWESDPQASRLNRDEKRISPGRTTALVKRRIRVQTAAEPAMAFGDFSFSRNSTRVSPPWNEGLTRLYTCSFQVAQLRYPRPTELTTKAMSIRILARLNGANNPVRSHANRMNRMAAIAMPAIHNAFGIRCILEAA